MSLLGTSWDDPKTAAILGLAGGLLQGNAGSGIQQGLLGAQRQSQLNRENTRQEKADRYSEEKHAMELAALKRAAMNDAALGQLIFGDAYPQIMGGQTATGGVAATSAAEGQQASQPRPGGPLANLDRSAVQMDYLLNKGKNLPEWLFKRNTPDIQVAGGYAYDKNRVEPGFMPSVTTSASGQTTVTVPNAQGGVSVQAPTGALDTYSAYRAADERAKAQTDLVQVPMASGQVRYMPRSEAIAATSGNAGLNRSYPTLGNANITDEVRGLIEADAARNGIQAPTIRMNTAVPGQTLGLAGAQVGVAPSKAEEAAATRAANAAVDVDVAKQANIKKATDFLRIADQAEKLLKSGPTQSGIGSAADWAGSMVGYTTKGAEAAQSLKAIGGWLVANVPRMEGPQSNFDVANYQVMAADVANDQLPVARRMAALKEIKSMMNSVIEGPSDMRPSGSGPKATPLPANPTASSLQRGTVYDTPRGRAMWDGMQFKKVD